MTSERRICLPVPLTSLPRDRFFSEMGFIFCLFSNATRLRDDPIRSVILRHLFAAPRDTCAPQFEETAVSGIESSGVCTLTTSETSRPAGARGWRAKIYAAQS